MAIALRNLQHAVNQCQDVIFLTDPAGVIERVNPAFEKLTGYSSVETVGQDLSWIVAEGPSSESYRKIWEQLFQGRTYRGDLQIRRKDGDPCELDVLIAPVRDSKGRTASMLCTGRDTSERRELETQLSHARRMDAMGTLAGGVVHDFNNMLMVISAYAELGLDSLPKKHPLRRNLQEILGASRRASELTRQLLAFGRQQVQCLQVFSLNSAVEEACTMLPCVIGEDIKMQVELGEDLGQVRADSGQIEQVLFNLAINARDAMPNGGKLAIETRLADARDNGFREYSTKPASGYIVLSVTDSGHGIPDKDLPRIFEPFYTTKPGGLGNGLGLSTAYGIVRQSEGFISAHSDPGKGSTFKIFLPVVAPPAREIASAAPMRKPIHGGSETLLVVEDETMVRQCEVEFLSAIGYTVLSVANGKEALEKVGTSPNMIDLVITDVVMPGMSGPRLAKELASLRPDLKVLFVSGYARETVQQKGVVDLTHNFLQKPFPLRVLAKKVREVLGQPVLARAAKAAGAG